MCQAIEEMRKDAFDEGFVKGFVKGFVEGYAEGYCTARGISGGIAICRDLGLFTDEKFDRIADRIADQLSLTRDEAEVYLRKALSEA